LEPDLVFLAQQLREPRVGELLAGLLAAVAVLAVIVPPRYGE
jgi:hypothetical protein